MYNSDVLLSCTIQNRKRKNMIPETEYKMVMSEIKSLHNSLCYGSFTLSWRQISKRWKDNIQLTKFHAYFEKTWVLSKFNNWKIFNTPPGFATTNSPIESYNQKIKAHFTDRLTRHIIPSLKIFEELIDYESSNFKEYSSIKMVSNNMEKLGRRIIKKLKVHEDGFIYKHQNGKKCIINVNNFIVLVFTFWIEVQTSSGCLYFLKNRATGS